MSPKIFRQMHLMFVLSPSCSRYYILAVMLVELIKLSSIPTRDLQAHQAAQMLRCPVLLVPVNHRTYFAQSQEGLMSCHHIKTSIYMMINVEKDDGRRRLGA